MTSLAAGPECFYVWDVTQLTTLDALEQHNCPSYTKAKMGMLNGKSHVRQIHKIGECLAPVQSPCHPLYVVHGGSGPLWQKAVTNTIRSSFAAVAKLGGGVALSWKSIKGLIDSSFVFFPGTKSKRRIRKDPTVCWQVWSGGCKRRYLKFKTNKIPLSLVCLHSFAKCQTTERMYEPNVLLLYSFSLFTVSRYSS